MSNLSITYFDHLLMPFQKVWKRDFFTSLDLRGVGLLLCHPIVVLMEMSGPLWKAALPRALWPLPFAVQDLTGDSYVVL